MHGIPNAFLSACLYVTRVHCDKTKENCAHILISNERIFILVFRHKEWLEVDPLYVKFWAKVTPFEQKRRFSIDIRSSHTSAPRNLADLCIPVTTVEGRRQLRSATPGTLVRTSTGQRSFAVFGPATWNSLPPSLRAPELSLSTFKRLLKTQLFQHA